MEQTACVAAAWWADQLRSLNRIHLAKIRRFEKELSEAICRRAKANEILSLQLGNSQDALLMDTLYECEIDYLDVHLPREGVIMIVNPHTVKVKYGNQPYEKIFAV